MPKVFIVQFRDSFEEDWWVEKVYSNKEAADKESERLNKKHLSKTRDMYGDGWSVIEQEVHDA